ncbi:cytochrome b [Shewanella salipaludis]|uniref:Cytochrome b n=1 Tax=Shewanella salipaludis TaxID=2723052 RepID=A0A972FS59_9GAMM|nr:cytochrome b [Shewanella salipaludis]NMH64721.1 cytochrome b [Shewanella salipaludis]
MFRGNERSYGRLAILVHWLTALVVLGLFALGVYMVQLSYYSSWYKTAPHIHKSVGILLLLLTLFRLVWRRFDTRPAAEAGHRPWEKRLAKLAHLLLYGLLLLIMGCGILISTADGRGLWVFDWFEIPSAGLLFADQADIAGDIHKFAAYGLMALVLIHAAGALKHHLFDKDNTLTKMLTFNRG